MNSNFWGRPSIFASDTPPKVCFTYLSQHRNIFAMLSASCRFLVKRAGSVAGGLTRVGGVRSYVAPMKDVDFLIKDVWDVPAHYKALGYDDQVGKGRELYRGYGLHESYHFICVSYCAL
jgi:hypothetical protein